jgi:GNAT superfamily N-acetyltransferase
MTQDATSLTMRLASIKDQPSMVSLINEAFVVETFLEGERTSAPELREMFETGEFLLAIANGVMVASVYTEVRGENGYFGMLAVRASQQGTGLGRSMIQAAEQHCRAKGCTRMELTVLSLRAELPSLYRKFGYTETSREPFQTTRLLDGYPPCELIHMSKHWEN